MSDIYLIRHGKTAGNMEKRYVGRTDEPLCEAGIREICARRSLLQRQLAVEGSECEVPKTVYVSPMLRCRQTAELLFPHAVQQTVTDFREMDFGNFEYKNYSELADDVRYQAFIDSGGCVDFPEAEPQQQFQQRVQKAFAHCLERKEAFMTSLAPDESREPLVFVVHGGTIMAIMEAYARPHRDYFDWQVSAGCGYRCGIKYEGNHFYLEHVTEL